MKTIRRLVFVSATLACAAAASAQAPDELAHDLARRAATYREVFDRLSKPEVSQAVLDGLAKRDPQVFEALGDGLEVHDVLRCAWVRSSVEAWLQTPIGREEKCFLRTNLTWEESILYFGIVRQYSKPVLHDGSLQLEVQGAGIEVPPGPFLEALREHGLVNCRDFTTFDTTIQTPLREVLNAYCHE
jgi:hypothetical protein